MIWIKPFAWLAGGCPTSTQPNDGGDFSRSATWRSAVPSSSCCSSSLNRVHSEAVDLAFARSDPVIRTRATIASRAHPAPFADWATRHPALIPQEAPGSSRRYPPIPAMAGAQSPAHAADPRVFPLSPAAP